MIYRKRISFIPLALMTIVPSLYGVIVLDSTPGWVAVQYNTPTDYISDQQTGQSESDLVGQVGYSAFFKAYENGGGDSDISNDTIGFRFRVSADENPSGFSKYGFVGVDADNDGSVDVFVGGNEDGINFYSPGTGLNISPNSTTVAALGASDTYMGNVVNWELGASASVFNFSPVTTVDSSLNFDAIAGETWTTADLDGGSKEDYFVSFQVDMETLMKAVYVSTELNPNKTAYTLDLNSTMSFMMVTSTQENSFNQDLNGQDGNALNYTTTGKDLTWTELGASSNPYTADGDSPVPEPSTYALFLGAFALAFVGARRRK